MQGRYQNVHRDENNNDDKIGCHSRRFAFVALSRSSSRNARGGCGTRENKSASLFSGGFLSAEIARRRFPVITTRPTYMLIRGLSRPPVFRRPFRTMCIAPRAARVFLQARDFVAWNVMRCDVCTLLRAMVTLQNDYLLPQSYYR